MTLEVDHLWLSPFEGREAEINQYIRTKKKMYLWYIIDPYWHLEKRMDTMKASEPVNHLHRFIAPIAAYREL